MPNEKKEIKLNTVNEIVKYFETHQGRYIRYESIDDALLAFNEKDIEEIIFSIININPIYVLYLKEKGKISEKFFEEILQALNNELQITNNVHLFTKSFELYILLGMYDEAKKISKNIKNNIIQYEMITHSTIINFDNMINDYKVLTKDFPKMLVLLIMCLCKRYKKINDDKIDKIKEIIIYLYEQRETVLLKCIYGYIKNRMEIYTILSSFSEFTTIEKELGTEKISIIKQSRAENKATFKKNKQILKDIDKHIIDNKVSNIVINDLFNCEREDIEEIYYNDKSEFNKILKRYFDVYKKIPEIQIVNFLLEYVGINKIFSFRKIGKLCNINNENVYKYFDSVFGKYKKPADVIYCYFYSNYKYFVSFEHVLRLIIKTFNINVDDIREILSPLIINSDEIFLNGTKDKYCFKTNNLCFENVAYVKIENADLFNKDKRKYALKFLDIDEKGRTAWCVYGIYDKKEKKWIKMS